jgi:hypothetical protein
LYWFGAGIGLVSALGCSNDCPTGSLDVMFGTTHGGNYASGGPATIERSETVLLVGDSSWESLSMQDVPANLLPDGETVYFELRVTETAGRISEQVSVFELENGSKGPLRGAVWSSLDEPEVEGVTFSAKPKDCGNDGACGQRRDTEMSAKVVDGPTLSAASGYEAQRDNVELGNGWSFMHERTCHDEPTELHHGYLFIRN